MKKIFMTSKEVEKEEVDNFYKNAENNFMYRFLHCGTPIMGFYFKTLREIQKTAAKQGKEQNEFILELLRNIK